MADLSDVLNALVTIVTGALYAGPAVINGLNQVSAAGPVVKVMRGTPFAAQLDEDLRAPAPYVVTVTVNESPGGIGKNCTRFPMDWQPLSVTAPSLNLTIASDTITISGTPTPGQSVLVGVAGVPYAYTVGATDTTSIIAAALASQVPSSSVVGSVITLPTSRLSGSVTSSGTSIRPTRTQEIGLQLRVYAPTFSTRDAVAAWIDNALSSVIRMTMPDSSVAILKWAGTAYNDTPQKALTFIRNLRYQVEFSTTQTQSFTTVAALDVPVRTPSGITIPTASLPVSPSPAPVAIQRSSVPPPPLIGAIRFDGWYSPSSVAGSVAAQLAAALSPAQYQYRLPWFAAVSSGIASWPAATQATIDAEIAAAVTAGLDYWAFDSYQPTDAETAALTLYLSSSIRSQVGFCMIGQFSNWSLAGGPPYAAAAARDIALFSQPGYVSVLGGRPLYYVLGSGTTAQMTAAVSWIRAQSIVAGTGNPYVVGLAGAAISQYNNVTAWALPAGCDSAGAYCNPPPFVGSGQSYDTLYLGAQGDWYARRRAQMPVVPTAMTDFDPTPLVLNPQPFYPVPASWSVSNYFGQGRTDDIVNHISAMAAWITANSGACPANTGLVYSWNELAEGGRSIIPTYSATNPAGDLSRALAIGAVLTKRS